MPHPVGYFSSIVEFHITFAKHPIFKDAHDDLNTIYADALPDHTDVFIDPVDANELKPDHELLPLLRHKIAQELIKPHATNTPTLTPILAIINQAPLQVHCGLVRRRLNNDSLTRALDIAIRNHDDSIRIEIGLAHVYFDTSSGPLNYLDWTKITTTKPTTLPPANPLTAHEIATAVATSVASAITIPPAPTAQQLATAFASAYPAPSNPPATATSTATPSITTSSNIMFVFNPAALPNDVELRYQNKLDKGLVLGSTVSTPYAGGNLYHLEGPDKIVLSDGTLFMIQQTPNEKELMKAQITCDDDTHAGIRAWYNNFVQACHDYGFYAHPLWCFKSDHGGDRGFTIGNDVKDDLPQRMTIPISRMTNPIFRLLSKKDMFPKNSRIPSIVRSCDGDGYRAIKALLFKSHPAFYDQPATLITSYPRQREHSMLEYYKLFLDFEQLRAYIADISITLADPTELDIVLKNAKYSSYLNRVTRDERRLRSNAHKYQGTQLIETLDKYLLAPDSPALRATPPARTPPYSAFQRDATKPLPVHKVQYNMFAALAESDDEASDDDDNIADTPAQHQDLHAQLHSIRVPDNTANHTLYHTYCASIYRLSAEPAYANSMKCLVCNGKHKFDHCEVLNNTQFLRDHYIAYCQHLKRHASSRAKAFPTQETSSNPTPLHFIDHHHLLHPNDLHSSDSDSDFQHGPRRPRPPPHAKRSTPHPVHPRHLPSPPHTIFTSPDDHTLPTSNLSDSHHTTPAPSTPININSIDLANLTHTPFSDTTTDPPPPDDTISDGPRAQIDTGAYVTCTDRLDLLHNYTPFTQQNPSPLRLLPATHDSDAVPLGYGFLHVPTGTTPSVLAVRAFYTPQLRTTVIDERDLVRAAGYSYHAVHSECLRKYVDSGTFTYKATISNPRRTELALHGILRHGKCYTGILIPPFSPQQVQTILATDTDFAEACAKASVYYLHAHQERQNHDLSVALSSLPSQYRDLPYHQYIQSNTPVHALRQETERLLWHQRLGHPSDYYLFTAHHHIKGVPRFKHIDPVLDQCPTCIRAKQTKQPPGSHTTMIATSPYQGLSIDFSFAGMRSSDTTRARDFVGLNGETCWILIVDHFTRMKHGSTRISKASPITWLDEFLRTHSPDVPNKYVHMDQGGELYRNPAVRDLFAKYHYTIRPTGADASNQNGPVERAHLTVANAVRAMLTGANLDVQFWPYAFHHWLRIDNAIPSRTQTASPLFLATGQNDDFTNFRTFGCRVWVRPPGRRAAKFRPNSRKGIFLGYLPNTTSNILWYDVDTHLVKIAKHARFDEGMNDLPLVDVPPNVVHLQRTNGTTIPADTTPSAINPFTVGSSPFSTLVIRTLTVTCAHPTFGFDLATDALSNRTFVAGIKPRTSASRLFTTPKATVNKLRGAYITRIGPHAIFTRDEALTAFATLRQLDTTSFSIEFAPEPFLYSTQRTLALREHNITDPEAIQHHQPHIHQLSIADLRHIAALRHPELQFDCHLLPTDEAITIINAIRSAATTDAEHALGHFTRKKLRLLDTWPLWEAGERKQLDQFHELGMYGPPTDPPPDAIILRQHWQYHIKRDGTRRARNCCDGSPRSAPLLHRFAQTYSSCVEQPVQRLFFALAAYLNLCVYGGDAKMHTHTHLHLTVLHTYVLMMPTLTVLPVHHALQGHPESGRLWESHITQILLLPDLGFQPTTHDRSIYRGTFRGHTLLLLRQVDDFALAAPSEDIAKQVFALIGAHLQLPSETATPFSYLGLLSDFNGIDVNQYSDRTVLSCATYIDRILRTHGWSTPSATETTSSNCPISPLPPDAIPSIYNTIGYAEDTSEHKALVKQFGFSYRALLGELLYAYVTCRPDIGYAVITLSKFATKPGAYHFSMLKHVVKYLRRTRHWGLHYQRSTPDSSLPPCPPALLSTDSSPPGFPALESGPTLTCFFDAAHANDLTRRRSTSGFAFFLANACISFRCKTQALTATSSTEAEFYAAVLAAKHALYLRSILHELGFPSTQPTPLYCDNKSAIDMINARHPTERSRHIMIQFFAIQDWKAAGDIVLRHIPGILNPADDLTKPLGWVLHARHARRLMGHYPLLPISSFDPCLQRSGEGVELVQSSSPLHESRTHESDSHKNDEIAVRKTEKDISREAMQMGDTTVK